MQEPPVLPFVPNSILIIVHGQVNHDHLILFASTLPNPSHCFYNTAAYHTIEPTWYHIPSFTVLLELCILSFQTQTKFF